MKQKRRKTVRDSPELIVRRSFVQRKCSNHFSASSAEKKTERISYKVNNEKSSVRLKTGEELQGEKLNVFVCLELFFGM